MIGNTIKNRDTDTKAFYLLMQSKYFHGVFNSRLNGRQYIKKKCPCHKRFLKVAPTSFFLFRPTTSYHFTNGKNNVKLQTASYYVLRRYLNSKFPKPNLILHSIS